MFTKAYITKLPEYNDNKYVVRIPLFEDNTGTHMYFTALLCNLPGQFNGYSVGDCVYVSFEGDTYNDPVIVGKLYTKVEDKTTMYTNTNELNVTTKATLPVDTTFGGYTPKDFFELCQRETGGSTYTAGYGISITNNVISVNLPTARSHTEGF